MDRQGTAQTDWRTDRQVDRQADIQADRQADIQTDSQTVNLEDKHTFEQTDRLVNRHRGRQGSW